MEAWLANTFVDILFPLQENLFISGEMRKGGIFS